ncbi:DEAD/DEAH box helicase family protein [Paenibacillus lemnae]|uniref:DEAD/DEAH box helicase family protein n=1 Tax=Paenibacillus lemnae TaxID=1330551 RepID=A0A848M0T2_PAELE|nr:DEAD/DEAH box helicase family protein [Paenibacillus lemnae]NMO94375.1 DEAD/DEAH box helicase family protein [Paenibacillus lemnae]
MKHFPEGITFRYSWRSYQQRILDQLDDHLSNRHLHLVAPPGSGKTVLGLEVMLRLNRPAFIIAPTLTIKNQWADRFRELFLQTGQLPEWVSTDIKNPAFVTVTTYQALHSLYKTAEQPETDTELELTRETEEEDSGNMLDEEAVNGTREARRIQESIRSMSFQTLILDEAHHLRSSWWKSAMAFRAELQNPAIVALTATPPYDVHQGEWQRYMELCGPIDAEISVPELVRESELCPHQDYICLSLPNQEEFEPLRVFRQQTGTLRQELLQDEQLKKAIEEHPWIGRTETHTEDILTNPSYYSSMVIYLKAAAYPAWEQAAAVLGVSGSEVPELTDEWLEELLTGLLYRDEEADQRHHAYFDALRRRLRGIGAAEKKKVYLRSTPQFDKMLIQSASKLRSIRDIVSFEHSNLKEELRMVILTDYIRKESFPDATGKTKPLTRLGVVPIFETLRQGLPEEMPLAILTGSLAVFPRDCGALMEEAAARRGLSLEYKPLPFDDRYVSLDIRDSNRSGLVAVMTEVFAQGGFRVMVGTAALLGEGWDAPCINSLIMASYVGSFMLSNQMRGRAIRTQKENQDKTAAIWHLACVDTVLPEGGRDLEMLSRRFRALVGLAVDRNTIETGMRRMNILQDRYEHRDIESLNQETFLRACERHRLSQRWIDAIALHDHMTEELASDGERVPRPLYMQHTIRGLIYAGIVALILTAIEMFVSPGMIYGDMPILMKLAVSLIVGLIAGAGPLYKGIRLYMKHQSLESSMAEAGQVVYETLYGMKLLTPKPHKHRLQASMEAGMVVCRMEGGSTQEQLLFLDSLQQLVAPINNPRYLIYRESRAGLLTRRDYYAVPEAIDRRKEDAERFYALWIQRIGPAELIYTRTTEGRKMLLTARLKAMSASFVPKSERISAWR